jgi:hypothetical protein
MNSFLRTLAARAIDQSQSVKPRLASLFEPPAGPLIRSVEASRRRKLAPRRITRDEDRVSPRLVSDDRTVAPTTRPAEIQQVARVRQEELRDDRRLIPAIVEPRATEEIAKPVDLTKSEVSFDRNVTPEPEPNPALRPANRNEEPIPEQNQIRSPEIQSDLQIAQTVAVENTVIFAPDTESHSDPDQAPEPKPVSVESRRPESIIVRPRVNSAPIDSPTLEATSMVQEAAPPSIRITIGRVEVRAIMPSTRSPAVAAQPPLTKALSLDEYLKKRNGAKN